MQGDDINRRRESLGAAGDDHLPVAGFSSIVGHLRIVEIQALLLQMQQGSAVTDSAGEYEVRFELFHKALELGFDIAIRAGNESGMHIQAHRNTHLLQPDCFDQLLRRIDRSTGKRGEAGQQNPARVRHFKVCGTKVCDIEGRRRVGVSDPVSPDARIYGKSENAGNRWPRNTVR